MIVKQVAAGDKTAGLLAYLYGPGVGEARGGTVHVNPRTVASWDGQPSVHSPKHLDSGRRSVGDLARRLDAPVALVTKVPAKHVGHIVVANHPNDPVLTDAQWRNIAADVMRRAGLSTGPQDPDAVRWIAVRHDDTSIHIAYTKVRESGRAAGYVNYTKSWESMRREWEERLGLTPTGLTDGTARRPYAQAESARAKAERYVGGPTARPDTAELRHLCRVIALEVPDLNTYLTRLRSAGITATVDEDAAGSPTDYRVGLRSRAGGQAILYSGARLEPELALDALEERWRCGQARVPIVDTTPSDLGVLASGAGVTPRAPAPQNLGDLLHRSADLLGDRACFDAAEVYAPAGRRMPSGNVGTVGSGLSGDRLARELRAVSRLLTVIAQMDQTLERRERVADLVIALAALLAEHAAWSERSGTNAATTGALAARRCLLAGYPALLSRDDLLTRPDRAPMPLAIRPGQQLGDPRRR